MPLTTGARLGPYEVVGAIGAGGMGEVYKARDTRLERTVAIKVLPALLAADPEFKARFEREAKSISALNHPHICTLYDVGEATGTAYLVMEHLEGETLFDRLKKGALPVPEALELASQIADALDKAHRQGIIHRDLKPANVFLVRGSGASGAPHAKLLDFGLAKIGVAAPQGSVETRLLTTPPPAGQTPAQTAPLTSQGSILGTFQYMAPEQIEGQDADARTDIWSFGCVLYEMLTGKRAFEGKSQASLIASILERQPTPMAELEPMTPPALGRLVRTCLEKNPDNRFHTAHDLWLHLQWIEEGGSAAGLPAPVVAKRKRRDLMSFAAAAAIVAALAAAAAWWLKPPPPAANIVTRFTDRLPDDQGFTRTGRRVIAISPDGSRLAYVANQQLYVRKMDERDGVAVSGTNTNPSEPVFSPDSESIVYWSAGATAAGEAGYLWRIPVSGGTPTRLCDANNPTGLSWTGSRILWGQPSGIMAVADTGGTPEVLAKPDSAKGERFGHPQLIAEGRQLLFAAAPRTWEAAQVVLQNLETGDRRPVVPGGTTPRLLPSGHLVFYRDNTLFAQVFDPSALAVRGSPVPVVQHARWSGLTGEAQDSVSDSGTLVFLESVGDDDQLNLAWVDRSGKVEPIPAPSRRYYEPRLSPDGNLVATSTRDDSPDIYVWDLRRRIETRVTKGDARDTSPIWSPDGRELLFATEVNGVLDIFRRRVDLTTEATPLGQTPESEVPQGFSKDGQTLVVWSVSVGADFLGRSLMTKPGPLEPLFGRTFQYRNATISPDGRWIAYEAREGEQFEVYVRPFPNVTEGRFQISQGGATWPQWSPNGRELFFLGGRLGAEVWLTAVPVKPSSSAIFDWGEAKRLFNANPYVRSVARGFDAAPDGSRFLVVTSPDAQSSAARPSINVVIHWIDELRARVKAP
jgi:Tol biopolymer transport system component